MCAQAGVLSLHHWAMLGIVTISEKAETATEKAGARKTVFATATRLAVAFLVSE